VERRWKGQDHTEAANSFSFNRPGVVAPGPIAELKQCHATATRVTPREKSPKLEEMTGTASAPYAPLPAYRPLTIPTKRSGVSYNTVRGAGDSWPVAPVAANPPRQQVNQCR